MVAKLRSWWQQIRKHPFIVAGIMVVIFVLIAFAIAVIKFGWDWSGFTGGESKITVTSISKGTTTATEMQPARTLWDWLGLLALLAVPVVVGFGAAWFTAQQGKVSARENTDNQRETALQAYIDKMSELILKEHLGWLIHEREMKPEDEELNKMWFVLKIARVRTLTVLPRLDGVRKKSVLQFLYESGLIFDWGIAIDLSGANLSGANLSGVRQVGVDLSGANLSGANLSGAVLLKAKLSSKWSILDPKETYSLERTDLRGANLSGADLREADLRGTNLSGADLRGAKLEGANLLQAEGIYLKDYARDHAKDLETTDLSGADLSNADLSNAMVTGEQLAKAKSLKGATMPDGSIHP